MSDIVAPRQKSPVLMFLQEPLKVDVITAVCLHLMKLH